MKKAILGKKLGMSQIFTPAGIMLPVTIVHAEPNIIVQVKTEGTDGYNAIQVGLQDKKPGNVNKPDAGHFKKANTNAKRFVREFRTDADDKFEAGAQITCDVFSVGDRVDVAGMTRGRGFTGTIQRWNTHRGPSSHGSGYHRGLGAMSANSTPSRVFKNKKMPGQYGNERVTIANLEIVKVDKEKNLLFIKGGIPGAKNTFVVVKQSRKA